MVLVVRRVIFNDSTNLNYTAENVWSYSLVKVKCYCYQFGAHPNILFALVEITL